MGHNHGATERQRKREAVNACLPKLIFSMVQGAHTVMHLFLVGSHFCIFCVKSDFLYVLLMFSVEVINVYILVVFCICSFHGVYDVKDDF